MSIFTGTYLDPSDSAEHPAAQRLRNRVTRLIADIGNNYVHRVYDTSVPSANADPLTGEDKTQNPFTYVDYKLRAWTNHGGNTDALNDQIDIGVLDADSVVFYLRYDAQVPQVGDRIFDTHFTDDDFTIAEITDSDLRTGFKITHVTAFRIAGHVAYYKVFAKESKSGGY